MDRTEALFAGRSVCQDLTGRLTDLLRAQPTLDAKLGNGSMWTVRDAAVHLVVASNVYQGIASGVPSPYAGVTRDQIAMANGQLAADVAETDPDKLADLVDDSLYELLDLVDGWPGDHPISFHGGLELDLAALVVIRASESLLHGFDIAAALGVPWPVADAAAALVLDGVVSALPLMVDSERAAGHGLAYGVEIRGGSGYTVCFADGACSVEPDVGDVDCVLVAEATALLLTLTGRAAPWPAFAGGQFSSHGGRPALAAGFFDLFVFP